MGWSNQFNWRTAKDVYKDYIEDIKRTGRAEFVGQCGAFLKCIRKSDDRPFLIELMVKNHSDGVWVKSLDSTTGFNQLNVKAADWLRNQLAKRNLPPLRYEAPWLLECERLQRLNRYIENLTPMDVLEAREDFGCTNGWKFKKGDQFRFCYKERNRVVVKADGTLFRLTLDIFFDSTSKDYPIVAVA